MKPHVKEYHDLLDQYMELSKEVDFKDRTSAQYLAMKLISSRLDQIRERSPHFTVHCIKSCYVGQGISFEPGETVNTYIDEQEARDHTDRCNKDGWAKGCFDHGVICQACNKSVVKTMSHYDKYADVYICSECKDKHGYI